jgi:hypothetical protein
MNYIKPSRKLAAICVLLLLFNSANAQKTVTKQGIAWYCYNQTLLLTDKYSLQTELHERRFMNPDVQFQSVIRTQLHRSLGAGWETSFGVALSLQDPNNPFAKVKLTVPEFRPHLEFAYNQKMQYFTLDHRYRAEARYFRNTNSSLTELEDGVDFANYRLRYRLQATVPVWKYSDKKTVKLKIADEIMLNAGEKIVTNVCDQNRLLVCLNLDLAENISFEMGYMNSFQQRSTGTFYDRDVLLCTVSHKINLIK